MSAQAHNDDPTPPTHWCERYLKPRSVAPNPQDPSYASFSEFHLALRSYLVGIRDGLGESFDRLEAAQQFADKAKETLGSRVEMSSGPNSILSGLSEVRQSEAQHFRDRLGALLDAPDLFLDLCARLLDPATGYADRAMIYLEIADGLPVIERARFVGQDILLRPALNIFQLEQLRGAFFESLPLGRASRTSTFSYTMGLGYWPLLYRHAAFESAQEARDFVSRYKESFTEIYADKPVDLQQTLTERFVEAFTVIVGLEFCAPETEYGGKSHKNLRILGYLEFSKELPVMTPSQREKYLNLVHQLEIELFARERWM